MRDEKWYDLIDNVKAKAKTFSESRTKMEFPHGNRGVRHTVVFTIAPGKFKLVRDEKYAIESEKRIFNNRTRQSEVVYTFSTTDKVYVVNLYKYNKVTGDWDEIDWRNLF